MIGDLLKIKPHRAAIIALHVAAGSMGSIAIFVADRSLFLSLDPFKLVLLSFAVTTPLTVLFVAAIWLLVKSVFILPYRVAKTLGVRKDVMDEANKIDNLTTGAALLTISTVGFYTCLNYLYPDGFTIRIGIMTIAAFYLLTIVVAIAQILIFVGIDAVEWIRKRKRPDLKKAHAEEARAID